MTVPVAQSVIPLIVVSVLGGLLAGLGYRLVPLFLRWTGWIGGASLGGVVGWQLLPQIAPEIAADQHLLWTAGLIVGGAIVGRLLLPVATRLAAIIAGFLSTAGAVGVFFLGDPIVNRLSRTDPTTEPVETAVTVTGDLQSLIAAQGVEVLGIMVAAGLLGGLTAIRFHTELIASGLTLAGAFLLGIVIPLWQDALGGDVTLGVGTSSVSITWAAAALVVGAAVQVYDHRYRGADERSFSYSDT